MIAGSNSGGLGLSASSSLLGLAYGLKLVATKS